MSPEAEAYIRARIKNPHVLARVMCMNPDLKHGDLIRGWNRRGSIHDSMFVVGKGTFIARRGREAWDHIPRRAHIRRGKRRYVGGWWLEVFMPPITHHPLEIAKDQP